jgi:two-component system, NtrC family, sensor kinase
VASALASLAEISARLTSAQPAEKLVQDAIEQGRFAIGAAELSLWLLTADGPAKAWFAGKSWGDDSLVRAALAAGRDIASPGTTFIPLTFGSRRLGTLVARSSNPMLDDEQCLLITLANLLSPVLANAERSRHLENEVQARVKQIEEQRRFTEIIVDSLPLGLYVVDREYRITAWNRKRERGVQGVAREEAIGRTVFELFTRQPADALRREFEEVFLTGRMQQYQMDSRATGERRTYRISKIPMRLDGNTVTHVIAIGEDITDWVEATERIAQAEKLAAIGQLAAGVMHEINNPLSTIAACAESLSPQDGLPLTPADAAGFLSVIEEEVQRCKRIVDGLLDFSRPKARERSLVSLNEVVERTLFLLRHHTRFKQLSLVSELDSALPPVQGDIDQFIQVLIALLINAADALPTAGSVEVRTVTRVGPEPSVVLEVRDRGRGIPRSHLGKIFEPFYTTKADGEGTGLGLSIAYAVVTEHGGRIEVDSEVDVGTTFRVLLPMVK